jgi:hypothetical protein
MAGANILLLTEIVTTRHHVLKLKSIDVDEFPVPRERSGYITLFIKSIDVAILATCQEVYDEAYPCLQRQLKKLKTEPARVIADRYGVTKLPTIATRMWHRNYAYSQLQPSPNPKTDVIEYEAADKQAYWAFLNKCSFYTEAGSNRSQTLLIAMVIDIVESADHTFHRTNFRHSWASFLDDMPLIPRIGGKKIGVVVKAGPAGKITAREAVMDIQDILDREGGHRLGAHYTYVDQTAPTEQEWQDDWAVGDVV